MLPASDQRCQAEQEHSDQPEEVDGQGKAPCCRARGRCMEEQGSARSMAWHRGTRGTADVSTMNTGSTARCGDALLVLAQDDTLRSWDTSAASRPPAPPDTRAAHLPRSSGRVAGSRVEAMHRQAAIRRSDAARPGVVPRSRKHPDAFRC